MSTPLHSDWDKLSDNRGEYIIDARPIADAPATDDEWREEGWQKFDAEQDRIKRYRVTLRVSGENTVVVEATSEDAAIELAEDQTTASDYELEHEFAEAVELPYRPAAAQKGITWPIS